MRVIVTGAAGFIGGNLVRALNGRGIDDVVAVDNLSQADKFHNLVRCQISEYFDKNEFLNHLKKGALGRIAAVFHQGACSNTMEHNGQYMLANNYTYTRALFEWCQHNGVPFLYASSAAVYGGGRLFVEEPVAEKPLNVYGYSKLLFDQVLRRQLLCGLNAPVFGFRYFNVYGDGEQHKGRMASVAFHHVQQMSQGEPVKLFGPYGGYAAGCQLRDFVSVEDVVKVNMHFFDRLDSPSGVYNLGTGRAQSFNDVALTVLNTLRAQKQQTALNLENAVSLGHLQYIPFPDALVGKYQCYTQADLHALRQAGYTAEFLSVEEGVSRYVQRLVSTKDEPLAKNPL